MFRGTQIEYKNRLTSQRIILVCEASYQDTYEPGTNEASYEQGEFPLVRSFVHKISKNGEVASLVKRSSFESFEYQSCSDQLHEMLDSLYEAS